MRRTTILICLLAAPLLVIAGGILAIGPNTALAVVGLGGGGAAAAPAKDDETKKDKDETGPADGYTDPAVRPAQQADMPLLPFPEMIVNVTDTTADGRQTSRFLKVNLLLVYEEGIEGSERLASRELYLRDAFQNFLRSLNVADLQGSAGMTMLKAELLRRARAVANTDAPRDILISDLVIQ